MKKEALDYIHNLLKEKVSCAEYELLDAQNASEKYLDEGIGDYNEMIGNLVESRKNLQKARKMLEVFEDQEWL